MQSSSASRLRIAALFTAGLLTVSSALAVPLEFQPKYDEGFTAGYTLGYDSGFTVGQERGLVEGAAQGKQQGFDSGWEDSYGPAYDLAYTLQHAIGVKQGYNDGVASGFEDGFYWAKSVAVTYIATNGGSLEINSGSFGQGIIIRSGNTGGGSVNGSLVISTGALTLDSPSVDWGAFFYGEGFTAGKSSGTAAGDADGYDEAYPAAFALAFDAAYEDGVLKGGAAGMAEGDKAGFDAGWSTAFGDGYDSGFDAGVDYFAFGTFSVPDGPSVSSLKATVPEPACLTLASTALIGLTAARRRRR